MNLHPYCTVFHTSLINNWAILIANPVGQKMVGKLKSPPKKSPIAELMEHRRKELPGFDLESICYTLFGVQGLIGSEDIPSFIAGGVGVDLLGTKYLPDFSPRLHKDVDLYLPVQKRGPLIQILRGYGAEIGVSETSTLYLLRTNIKKLPFDFFSTGLSDNGILVPIPGKDEDDLRFVEIAAKPDWVVMGSFSFCVLDAASQLKIQETVTEQNPRDMEILRRICGGMKTAPKK